MRERKQSDSPSGYDREIRPRRLVLALGDHEKHIRLICEERWRRRVDALQMTDGRPADDWEGCVD